MSTGDARVAQEEHPDRLCVFGSLERPPVYSSMYLNNPRICFDIANYKGKLNWISNYPGYGKIPGMRPYIIGVKDGKVQYNLDYRPEPGEIYFSEEEMKAVLPEEPYIYVEPNTKTQSEDGSEIFPIGHNKKWFGERWKQLFEKLSKDYLLVQAGNANAQGYPFVRRMYTNEFRDALWLIKNAQLIICTDGAVHHAAAAMGKKAVVIWGGVTAPTFLGYDSHVNLWPGNGPCGSIHRCKHCREEMEKITVDQVEEAVRSELQ